MKFLKFFVFLFITLLLTYFLNSSQKIGAISIPPMGHFFDPFNGFIQNADKDAIPFPEDLNLEGLKGMVTITYDTNYVPHIFADHNEDLFFAQGYYVAQNRLWQMEFMAMAAAGRLSEILGENKRILEFDRLQRRKGMVFGAENSLERMLKDPEVKNYLEAYSNGVNAYINSLSYQTLPLEYKLMDYQPQQWTIFNSALILQYMIENLTGYDSDLENTNALALFGKETFDLLFPEQIPGIDPTIPTDGKWNFKPVPTPKADLNYPLLLNYQPVAKTDPDNGSNNWAVAPTKSATGNALLANDPHLGLNLPSLWIMLHLQGPDFNTYGFTFPGAAGITAGFNDSISWGFTNAPRDSRDWYSISFKDPSKKEYSFNSEWKESRMVVEEINIKGNPAFYDTITYTHLGPIVYDDHFKGTKHHLALKWGGHQGSMVQKALLLLNKAKNYEDYNQALEYWDQPFQNIVFASVQGDIAMTVAGDFPLKWPGQGKFIMEGSNINHGWGTSIPKEHNAIQINPKRGFVSSANQHSVDKNYPYWFYSASNEYFRNRRINKLLGNKNLLTIEDMMNFQNDNYSIKAEEALPILMESIKVEELSPEEKAIYEDLKTWDFEYKAHNKSPVYFNAWWNEFYNMLWDEFDRDEILKKPDEYVTIYHLKNKSINNFIDMVDTSEIEDLPSLTTISFKEAVNNLSKWKEKNGEDLNWGKFKNTSIIHLARLEALGHYGAKVSGHSDALNATKGSHGPSFRMVVEMSNPPQAWGIYPGGQSGNPGNLVYDNFIDEWTDGKYRKLFFPHSVEEARSAALKIQFLNPQN
ncbi:penicillin acylase family protein [soil metagenome]